MAGVQQFCADAPVAADRGNRVTLLEAMIRVAVRARSVLRRNRSLA